MDVIDLTHKSQHVPVPYPTTLHSEQKCAHFCSERSIVRYGTCAFGIRKINLFAKIFLVTESFLSIIGKWPHSSATLLFTTSQIWCFVCPFSIISPYRNGRVSLRHPLRKAINHLFSIIITIGVGGLEMQRARSSTGVVLAKLSRIILA